MGDNTIRWGEVSLRHWATLRTVCSDFLKTVTVSKGGNRTMVLIREVPLLSWPRNWEYPWFLLAGDQTSEGALASCYHSLLLNGHHSCLEPVMRPANQFRQYDPFQWTVLKSELRIFTEKIGYTYSPILPISKWLCAVGQCSLSCLLYSF